MKAIWGTFDLGIPFDFGDHIGRRDALSALQIHDLAKLAEFVELAAPVVAKDQDVGLVLPAVLALELKRLFQKDAVHAFEGADDLHPLGLGVDWVALFLAEIECVR